MVFGFPYTRTFVSLGSQKTRVLWESYSCASFAAAVAAVFFVAVVEFGLQGLLPKAPAQDGNGASPPT